MKALFIVTAVIEAGTGLALEASPAMPVSLLFGAALDTPVALAVGRVAGAAPLSLGAVCWLARHDDRSHAAAGLVAGMILYNTAVVAILADARFRSGISGVGFWPGIVLHVTMAGWCIACLRMKRERSRQRTQELSS